MGLGSTSQIPEYWRRLARIPGGRSLFNLLLRWFNPYSGAIRATIITLDRGHCCAELGDRRALRNHLNSIHALALANFGELVSGLALLCCLPDTIRGIPVNINTQYLKKARGKLHAETRVTPPDSFDDIDFDVTASIRDKHGDTVAIVTVTWRLGIVQ